MSNLRSGAPSRILVVEDEPAINDVIATALRFQGHEVAQIDDGGAALHDARSSAYDLIVLDVLLPGVDGYEICRRLRDDGNQTPVLFLTAKAEAADRIRGLATGADDYLAKPFSVDELVLRVAAILRRTGTAAPAHLMSYDELTLDPESAEVRRAGRLINLSPTELRLLEYLLTNATIVLSKAQILVEVWGHDFDGSDNVVELYIGYLRRKIDDGRTPLIHTRRGLGYVLRRAE